MIIETNDMLPEIVVATTPSGVIGLNGTMPWHLPEDLKKFKDVTMGGAIIMGRKTFESIGRILPGRLNIVLTRSSSFVQPGILLAPSLKEALILAAQNHYTKTFVIGGSLAFEEALEFAKKAHITLIETEVEGDTFFPLKKLKEKFHLYDRSEVLISKSGLRYSFEIWERN